MRTLQLDILDQDEVGELRSLLVTLIDGEEEISVSATQTRIICRLLDQLDKQQPSEKP